MSSSAKKAGKGSKRPSAGREPDTSDNALVLDQNEVIKAMLAMAGKRKAESSGDEGSEDGDESERSSEVDSDEEKESTLKEENTQGATDDSDSDTNAEAGPSSPRPTVPSRAAQSSISRVNISKSSSTPAVTPTPFSSEPKPAPTTTFESLGLSAPLISALGSINISKPTEIQSACIGPIMGGRDCIGGAKTGSGKTLAFALPIVERIARDPFGVWAVVLTPTRELAYQLTEQFLAVGRPLGLTTITIVGGMDSIQQAKELEARPHIIVATPGRLCDLIRSDSMQSGKLGRVRTLVLDEADRLLTPTFAPDLAFIFSQIPPNRQTCLFTATVSDAIMELANKPPAPGKQKPFVYRVESETLTVGKLKQKYLFIPSQIRDPYLVYLLQHPPSDIDAALRAVPPKPKEPKPKSNRKRRRPSPASEDDEPKPSIPSTIIFTQRCATAHLLHLLLTNLEIPSVPLHSHLTQPQRLLSLARFRAREVPVLVTTDVGSRGLDIPSVAMVINWDCPRRSDDYVHRVGRTARAGRGGVAVTVVTERDVELVQQIEKDIGVSMTEMELPEEEVLEALNAVSLARRMATMEMHDSAFGERQATNKAKAIKRAKRDAAAAS